MADVARCKCPLYPAGGIHVDCPIHGLSPRDPLIPYVLSEADRVMLKTMRIATANDAQQVRQAEEDRWRRE